MRTRTPICDSCEILVINNVACHELGCPDRNKPMKYRRKNGTRKIVKPVKPTGVGGFKP
jgi:hypothetical protein